MGRQVANEEALVAALRAHARVAVTLVDLATLDFAAQARLVAEGTDVLVGMHGAALTHALYLPRWAGVLELWPKPTDMWRCFELLATMAGVAYDRWANADAAALRADAAGDYLTLPVEEIVLRILAAADGVAARLGADAAVPAPVVGDAVPAAAGAAGTGAGLLVASAAPAAAPAAAPVVPAAAAAAAA
jgi:hypothetical protein